MGSLQEVWQDKQDIHRRLKPVIHSSAENTIGEDEEYEEIIKEAKSRKRNYEFSMDAVPVNFSTQHKSMIGNCKMFLEREGGYIAIN